MDKRDFDDEKELDSLFSDPSDRSQFSKVIQKAKRRSLIRTVFVCFVVVIILTIGGQFVGRSIVDSERSNFQGAQEQLSWISGPNKYIGTSIRYEGTFNGRTVDTTYKLIAGKVVYTGQQEYSYGLFSSDDYRGMESPSIIGKSYDEEDTLKPKYNQLGQREMVFFYPFVNYEKSKQDLNLLKEIGPDKIMEIALSFDKSYTVEQVKALLPKNIAPSWYWVDDLSKEEKATKGAAKDRPARILSETQAYGWKTYNADGEIIDKPEEMFLGVLKNAYENKDRIKGNNSKSVAYKSEFNRVFKNIAGQDGKLTVEDLAVQGVVVTGDVEALESLVGLPFIKASSLGVVTDKY